MYNIQHSRTPQATLFILAYLLTVLKPINAVADYTPGAQGCVSCPEGTSESDCKKIACPSEYASCGLIMNSNDAISGGMDWSNVGQNYIKYIHNSSFKKVWNAKTLSGPSTYYYPSDKSPVTINGKKQYEFEKYTVQLSHILINETVVFYANICVNPPNGYIDQKRMQENVFEKWPKQYVYALQIISDNGHGIQFFHPSYVGGAYGGKGYIDTGTSSLPVLMHESGSVDCRSWLLIKFLMKRFL